MQQSSAVTRYLIFFQYLGTKYSGVMKAPGHQPLQGVQNHLENAVRKLKPVNDVSVSISSRTDTGVHALCNSAHLDIQRRGDKPPFTEQVLTDALNFLLKPEPIRELDVDAMREAGAMFQGTHDFSTFRALSSDAPFKNPVKTMELVQVDPGLSFSQRHFHRDIQFWELTFKSRSFLYKQVRRMVGALVAVGRGKLSIRQVQDLLDSRDSMAYPQNMAAPPYGLFLINVEYNDSDLKPSIEDTDCL
ncbi:tRNA pseudouridine synthase-like 1 isoform X2 [Hemibagrus wyckioides]|uniref:tRNA pseudouridine synthase-like 1 isoform X2 n=1 Tax=Hemibagrus wyckioides TaxID=337641 RepID=UPI00266D80F0|nr:tRNA pseudouridine synthase-like 1 isoform X2 [Hemibagrus wyckioides]